ncbi:hypothetical protein GF376_00240 [Candidatus Peregrinibacteria bacterium]|nr:hypothetical protein [Candidatus Peregrinibacteria bacterium]
MKTPANFGTNSSVTSLSKNCLNKNAS